MGKFQWQEEYITLSVSELDKVEIGLPVLGVYYFFLSTRIKKSYKINLSQKILSILNFEILSLHVH